MKGKNTVHLNQETMVSAVQTWANATYKRPPKVLAVRTSLTWATMAEEFDVDVEEQDDAESSNPEVPG